MNITKLKWTNPEHNSLKVTLDNGTEMSAPWPCETWHREYIQEFMDRPGHAVEAHDPPPAPPDMSQADNQSKEMRAMISAIANLTGKTPAQAKAAFKAAWDSIQ